MSTLSLKLRLKHKVGDVIADRYEIVEEIKSGGMGTVYKVRDKSLGLYYACKEMDLLDKREEFLDKFRREAVNLQKLHNPHIPKAFYVEHKGVWLVCPVCGDTFYGVPLSPCHKQKPMVIKKRYYLMMEFIEGEDLEERIEKEGKPLREEDVVRWTLDVCSALKEIHSMGMVHRDVKPDNIMIDSKNRAYLLDMGLVKETVTVSGYGTVQMSQTSNMGTPGYAPIEQYRYGSPESRSDIYALGMTMYRLLANKDPRDSTQLMEMDSHNPRYFNSNISSTLEEAILKAIKEDKEKRFKDISELEESLKQTITKPPAGGPVTTLPTPPSRMRRQPTRRSQTTTTSGHAAPTAPTPAVRLLHNVWAWSALVLALLSFLLSALRLWAGLAAVMCGVVGWRRAQAPSGQERWFAISALGIGLVMTLVASYFGVLGVLDRIKPLPAEWANQSIHVVDIYNGTKKKLVSGILPPHNSVPKGHVIWSPNGDKILFWRVFKRRRSTYSDFHIYMADADGNNFRPIAEGDYYSWSPDGKKIAFVEGHDHIVIASADDGRKLRQISGPIKGSYVENLTWSPDGKKIAFIAYKRRGNSYPYIYVMNSNGKNLKRLFIGMRFAWAPDSKRIAVSCPGRTGHIGGFLFPLRVVNVDGSNIVRIGKKAKTVTQYRGTYNGRTLWGKDYKVQEVIESFAWSPDSSKIAFISYEGKKENYSVCLITPDGSNRVKLAEVGSAYQADSIAWSPNGRQIAFRVRKKEGEYLYLISSDGINRKFVKREDIDYFAWSPNGKRIAFSGDGLHIVNCDSGNCTKLYSYTPGFFEWSPDSKKIAVSPS